MEAKSNPAFGHWTTEETNWSKKDLDFIQDVLKEKPLSTSYEELLAEHEAKLLQKITVKTLKPKNSKI